MTDVPSKSSGNSGNEIDPNLSVFLDLLRFLAAMVVLVGHASGMWLTGGYLWQVQSGLRAAVIVFFVLSGYVIAATVNKTPTAVGYAAARLSRLYSVVIPALALTFILDYIGASLRPDFYYGEVTRATAGDANITDNVAQRYLLSALFLQKWWVLELPHPNPGTNNPFWSLSFEFAYYVSFFILTFMRGRMKIIMIAMLFLLTGPEVLALWPIWLLGVFVWRARTKVSVRWGWLMTISALAGFTAFFYLRSDLRQIDIVLKSIFGRDLVSDYFVAICTALLVLGFSAVSRALPFSAAWIAKPVRYIADHTFEVYLLHFPILYFAAAISPYPLGAPIRALFIYAVVLGTIFLVARATTPLRHAVRSSFTSSFNRIRVRKR